MDYAGWLRRLLERGCQRVHHRRLVLVHATGTALLGDQAPRYVEISCLFSLTRRTWLVMATEQLAPMVGDTARRDAELLLAHTIGCSRSHLLAWPEHTLTPEQHTRCTTTLDRLCTGEPLAYVLGHWDFWTFTLTVTPDTLIPRPETEGLVALALEQIPHDRPARVADLGTGSGAIALAIALERPLAQITATDHSLAALAVAAHNAHRLGVQTITFQHGDWCAPLTQSGAPYDLIVSNPPYIVADHPALSGALRFEPYSALVADHHGLAAIDSIIAQAQHHLTPGGWLYLEHGYDQGPAVIDRLRAAGYVHIRDHIDFAGIDRISVGQKPLISP